MTVLAINSNNFNLSTKDVFGEEQYRETAFEEKPAQTDDLQGVYPPSIGNKKVTIITSGSKKSKKDKSLDKIESEFIYKIKTLILITKSILSLSKSAFAQQFSIVNDFYSIVISLYKFQYCDFTSIKNVALNLFYLAEAIVNFICTIVLFPIRLGCVLLKDIFKSVHKTIHLIKFFNKGSKSENLKELAYYTLIVVKDVLFLVGLVYGSVKLTLVSIAIGLILGGIKVYLCLKKDDYLICLSNVLHLAVNIRHGYEKCSKIFKDYFPANQVA